MRPTVPVVKLALAVALFAASGCDCNGKTAQPVDVTVTLDPMTATVPQGQTQMFKASVAGTLDEAVTFTVEEIGGGVVSAEGLYLAPSALGTYHVKAASHADPTRFATATVTVVKATSAVTVTLSPANATVKTQATQQFVAGVTGAESTDVFWTVREGAAGGTVTSTGLYTAPATPGAFHVVATSAIDPNASATATVTVTQAPAVVVSVNPAALTLGAQQTQQFTAAVMNATNTAVEWAVQEASGGTISAGGFYTAPLAPGVYHVVAFSKAQPAASAVATVTVQPIAATVTPATALVEIGSSQAFTALVSGAGPNTAVVWAVQEGPSCGTVSAAGVYSPPSSPMACHVVATSVLGGTPGVATVTVIYPVNVAVVPSSVTLSMGQTQAFAATVSGSSNHAVSWSVREGAVGGTITAAGVYTAPTVTAQSVFHVVATAQANPAKAAEATVTVVPGIGVQVSPQMVTLAPGAAQGFAATVTGTATPGVTWAVQEGAAGGTISAQGQYLAPQSSGTYHVVASAVADPNKKGFATVVVLGAPVDVTGVVTYPGGKTGTVYVILAPSDAAAGIVGTSAVLANGQAPFTLKGVQQRGDFTVRAFIDTLDTGMYHQAVDPFGSIDVTVTNAGLSNLVVPAADSQWNGWVSMATPSLGRVVPGDELALVTYSPAWDPRGNDECKDYRLYWSDRPGVSTTNNLGSLSVVANAPRLVVVRGLTNGQQLYFTMTCPDARLLGGLAPEVGPVTIGGSSGGLSLSGTVNSPALPGGLAAPLYVVALPKVTGGSAAVARVSSPSASQPWALTGLSSGSYDVYAFRDVASDGRLTPTDPGNFFEPVSAVIAGASQIAPTIDLPVANAVATVTTGHLNDGGAHSYSLFFRVRANLKRPVTAQLTAGAKIAVPYDLPLNETGGARHEVVLPLGNIAPAAGDAYQVSVRYADGTTEVLTATVGALLPAPALSTPVTVAGPTPSFQWSALSPTPPFAYTVSLRLYDWPYLALGSGAQVLGYADELAASTTLLLYSDVHPTRAQLAATFVPYWVTLSAVDTRGNWSKTVGSFIVQ